MAATKKAAKAGAGAYAAGKAARKNPYVQKLIEDDGLRDELRNAYDSARKAYSRLNGKGPAKALDDKKVQKEFKEAASSLKSAAETLRKPAKAKRRKRKTLLGIVIVGGIVALVASEGLRKKVLDALFGAEEEFEYTSTTTPSQTSGSTSQKETADA
ncbi:MAG TPA: hypothetical protein VFD31_09305 [Thermoleophilaceae bacterium]|nr:hypothetical protein [Thermoleophilaceae bacterium]